MMLGLRRATAAVGDRSTADRSSAQRPLRTSEGGPGRLGAPAFAIGVLALAAALAIMAPWRAASMSTLSDYSPRGASSPIASPATATALPVGATLAPAPAAANQAPASTVTPVATPASTVEAARPVGLPVQRNDWIIIRDYVAHGGPGSNGAIDIGVMGDREAVGTPIYATHDGTVRLLRNNKLYGNLVAVKNARWSTTYGHLDQVMVTEGQAVRRGDIVGTMGATGRAATPQVDYQVWERVDGRETNRNPIDFITPR